MGKFDVALGPGRKYSYELCILRRVVGCSHLCSQQCAWFSHQNDSIETFLLLLFLFLDSFCRGSFLLLYYTVSGRLFESLRSVGFRTRTRASLPAGLEL